MKLHHLFIAFSAFLLSLILLPNEAQAHEPDHTYLYLRIYEKAIDGRVEITATEINKALSININEEISEEEVSPYYPQIKQLLSESLSFGANGKPYPVTFTEVKVLNLDDESDFIEFHFQLENVVEVPSALDISYTAFFENNPNHKGVLIIEYNWKAGIINNYSSVADIFTQSKQSLQLSLADASIWTGFWAMIKLGVWHIWIGLDHILFLVALVLPAVVRRETTGVEVLHYRDTGKPQAWYPVAKFKPALIYILKIVTFFTIAHSITLAISSLNFFTLSSRYVETIIAVSIAIAAFHNIIPIFKSKEWVVAFAFGLFHGFGFASVLGEKGLGGDYMILSLLGFNGGVELGQVAIIAVVFPILFLIRKANFYPKIITYGSVALIIISLHWSIERFFEFNIPIGRWITGLFG